MTLDLDRKMAQLELKLLRAQLNSHFMFNNLNAINFYILQKDPQKASFYLTLFSRLMRRIMAGSQRDFIKLSEEIETLRLYVQLESMRFNHPIELQPVYGENIDPEMIMFPSLLLHTYIEHAIWNHLLPLTQDGKIRLGVFRRLNKFHIVLEDNGIHRSETHAHRLMTQDEAGLQMAEERVFLLNQRHGTDIQVQVVEVPIAGGEPGRRVEIEFEPIPFTKPKQ
ncbi:sensor histidine kinase [Arundinibacter roseus]|uniref:Histidine kinase n=1 Tax=Arundinibacter roseus TaxID=2070510 RepID=A0A4R4JXG5_9BACT|nr:histidine kinase [Arundinibacter roseus]TDB58671.1 histidine kinase [Arundinibacter roseus]